jgi:hypothetical protein
MTIIKPMEKHIKQGAAVEIVKHFTDYFEENC